MKRQPRLQFTDAELSPKLKRHVRRAERAADKAERAREKIPKNRKKLKRRMIEQQSAKVRKGKKHLYFEDVDRPKPPSKLGPAEKPHIGTRTEGNGKRVQANAPAGGWRSWPG